MDARLVYVTAGSDEEARAIGRVLVEERLAACVNIIGGMTSIYRWEGRIEQAAETVLIAKTEAALVPALGQRVRALHSYETPCIVALPVLDGDAAYLAWIAASIRRPEGE